MKLFKLFWIAVKETLAIWIPCLRKPIDYSAVEKKIRDQEFKSGSKIYVFHASPYGDYPDLNIVFLDEAEDDGSV